MRFQELFGFLSQGLKIDLNLILGYLILRSCDSEDLEIWDVWKYGDFWIFWDWRFLKIWRVLPRRLRIFWKSRDFYPGDKGFSKTLGFWKSWDLSPGDLGYLICRLSVFKTLGICLARIFFQGMRLNIPKKPPLVHSFYHQNQKNRLN